MYYGFFLSHRPSVCKVSVISLRQAEPAAVSFHGDTDNSSQIDESYNREMHGSKSRLYASRISFVSRTGGYTAIISPEGRFI